MEIYTREEIASLSYFFTKKKKKSDIKPVRKGNLFTQGIKMALTIDILTYIDVIFNVVLHVDIHMYMIFFR